MAKNTKEVSGWLGWVGFASFMLLFGGAISLLAGLLLYLKME